MSDQWDEKAREIARTIATDHFGGRPMIAFPFENRCQRLIAAALRAAYDRGVEDSAIVADKFDGAVAFTDQLEIARAVILRDTEIIARIRALKRGGK